MIVMIMSCNTLIYASSHTTAQYTFAAFRAGHHIYRHYSHTLDDGIVDQSLLSTQWYLLSHGNTAHDVVFCNTVCNLRIVDTRRHTPPCTHRSNRTTMRISVDDFSTHS